MGADDVLRKENRKIKGKKVSENTEEIHQRKQKKGWVNTRQNKNQAYNKKTFIGGN